MNKKLDRLNISKTFEKKIFCIK